MSYVAFLEKNCFSFVNELIIYLPTIAILILMAQMFEKSGANDYFAKVWRKFSLIPFADNQIAKSNNVAIWLSPLVLSGVAILLQNRLKISYAEIVGHGFLPIIIIYISYLANERYRNKLESKNFNQEVGQPFYLRLINFLIFACAAIIFINIIYYFVGAIKIFYNEKSFAIMAILILTCYVLLIFYSILSDNYEENFTIKSSSYYFLPIFLLFWLVFMEKININFASIYSVALFGIIILTHEALKSSFMQRKRLKKPKVSAEIYLGLIKIKHSITASIKIYLFFLRDTLIVIIIYVFLTAIIQFINSPAIELKLLFLLLTFAIIPRKIPIFLQFFLTLKSCELLKLTENPLQLQQYLLIFYGVIALNLIKDYLYCRKKNWNKQNWLVVLIPFLIFINGDLILLNSQTIEHGLIITLIMTLSAIIWAAGTAQFWIVKNSKFESCCLVFASFIMFVPNFFIYPIFNYLPHNLQNGAKYVVYFPILCMVILIYFRQQARKMVNIN